MSDSSRNPVDTAVHARTGLPRRLAAMVYDALLLAPILMLATVPWVALRGGEAVSPGNELYSLYLLAVALVFYGGFWTLGGQTLGMRAWRLRIVTLQGGPVRWRRASIRYGAAIVSLAAGGLGFFWQWLDPQRLTWHDRASGTCLIRLPRASRGVAHRPPRQGDDAQRR